MRWHLKREPEATSHFFKGFARFAGFPVPPSSFSCAFPSFAVSLPPRGSGECELASCRVPEKLPGAMNTTPGYPPAASSVRTWFIAVLCALVLFPLLAQAQVGRLFVTAEAHVALARAVHVGTVVVVEPVKFDKALEGPQKFGVPHRVVLEVTETLRGDPVKLLELVLALQSVEFLETARVHGMPVLVTAGQRVFGTFGPSEVGIEEQGRPVKDYYHFRILDAEAVPADGARAEALKHMNLHADEGRMFTNELGVVTGSTAVLKRMRTFAKDHPDPLKPVLLIVPDEYARLVGDPGAYGGLVLPATPETRKTLEALKKDPGIILRQIQVADEEKTRGEILEKVEKALGTFPEQAD